MHVHAFLLNKMQALITATAQAMRQFANNTNQVRRRSRTTVIVQFA